MNHDTQKKKVLYVITKSNFGGAQRYVYDLARHLPKDQFDVTVALGGTGEKNAGTGMLKEKLVEANIPVIPITHFLRDMSLFEDVRAFFELLRIVQRVRPDVLHVTSSKAGGMGAFIGRITRTPQIIFTSHGLAFDESWRPKWQRMFIWLASWCTFLFTTSTIQITHDTYTRARKMPFMKHRQVLIHNGRETPAFLDTASAREKLCSECDTDMLWIGTIAELTKNKNLDVLIEAFALLHKKGIVAHLFILSEGEMREQLEQLVASHALEAYVHLPGYVENAATLLPAFDIFTLPSKKEGLPYVLIEAGLASLPVVASTIPGISDIVTHEETGLLVDPAPETLAHAFQTLAKDERMRQTYGTTARARMREQFSIERMVEQTTKLYSDVNPSSS